MLCSVCQLVQRFGFETYLVLVLQSRGYEFHAKNGGCAWCFLGVAWTQNCGQMRCQ